MVGFDVGTAGSSSEPSEARVREERAVLTHTSQRERKAQIEFAASKKRFGGPEAVFFRRTGQASIAAWEATSCGADNRSWVQLDDSRPTYTRASGIRGVIQRPWPIRVKQRLFEFCKIRRAT